MENKKPSEPLEPERWAATTIRLPTKLREQLGRQAEGLGVTLHDRILFILWDALQNTAPE